MVMMRVVMMAIVMMMVRMDDKDGKYDRGGLFLQGPVCCNIGHYLYQFVLMLEIYLMVLIFHLYEYVGLVLS